ncbi:hypothetical protein NL676_037022 [Syzygium grande]|nr:hypothetical protein NL676_037022 [Syzygium grande]
MGRDAFLGRDGVMGGTSQESERREGRKIGEVVVVHYRRDEGGGGDESTLPPVPERWTGIGLGAGTSGPHSTPQSGRSWSYEFSEGRINAGDVSRR